MARIAICLIMLVVTGAPALAKADGDAHDTGAVSTLGAARLAAAYGNITSMFRTAEHNRAVGGVANSYHLQGRAIDVVRRSGVTHRQLDALLRNAGYMIVESLDEGDHSHFAFGPADQRVQLTPAVVRYPPPPDPTGPEKPYVLADEHGTLRVDLASREPASSPASP